MIKSTISVLIIFLASHIWAQSFNWGQSIGGIQWETSTKIIETPTGELLRCGTFYNTVDFDPGGGVTNLTSNGVDDLYIEKIDTSGSLVWVRSVGGLGQDMAADIVLDVDENIYIFGQFSMTVDFDPGSGVSSMTSQDNLDAFILKLNSSGDFIWVKQIKGNNNETIRFATIGANNYIYICGTFEDTTDFDPGTGIVELVSNGQDDIFIQKIDTAGNFIWVRGIGGIDDDASSQIALDSNGYLYTAGHYKNTVDFDPGLGVMNSTSNGDRDLFVIKLDTLGMYVWHRSIGGTGSDYSTAFCNDNDGNVYSTGWYFNTVDFDPGPGTELHTAVSGSDFFLQKFSPSGEMLWTKVIGGAGSEYANRVTSNGQYLYLSGVFSLTTDFDPTPGVDLFTAVGNNDGFVMKMDTVGNRLWTRQIGGPGNESVGNLVISSTEDIYIGGTFQDSIDVDPGAGVYSLEANGLYDIFLTKLQNDPCGNFSLSVDSMSVISCSSDGNAYTSSIYGTNPINYTWNTVPSINAPSALFDIAGLYQLSATDSNNCVATANVIISGSSAPLSYDLNSNALSLEFRPGFISSIWVDAFNGGCVPVNGQLKLVLDAQTTFSTATIWPNQIIGDTLIWDYPTMTYDSAHFVPKVRVMTNIAAVIGDTVRFMTIITPIAGDTDTLNNIKSYCYPIVNAYDPNDKQVYPQGDCSDHFIAYDQRLTYKVRFQNTGNSQAINIVVKDTISALLDVSSVQIVGQSHEPLITTMLPGNVLNFSFLNINLADSTSNEDESHGYVIFEISPITGISDNAVIENKVEIYFDYNPEVVTNIIFNTIQTCSQFAVSVDLNAIEFCEGDLLVGTTNETEDCYDFFWQLDTLMTSSLPNFNWQSDTSGIFNLFISKANSICYKDSLISLVIHPKQTTELLEFQCFGDSLFVGGAYQFLAGQYLDSLQTTFGCDSIVSTILQNFALPNVSLSAFDPDTVCSNYASLNLPIGSPLNGVYYSAALNQGQFDVSLGEIGINYLTYTYIDSNNCVNSDSSSILIDDCAGLSQLESMDFQMYPNPTVGKVNIKFNVQKNAVSIEIRSMDGKLIQSVVEKNVSEILLDFRVDTGVYFVDIIADDIEYERTKIVKL